VQVRWQSTDTEIVELLTPTWKPSPTSPTPTSPTPTNPAVPAKLQLSVGVKVGIAISVLFVFFMALLGVVVFLLRRRLARYPAAAQTDLEIDEPEHPPGFQLKPELEAEGLVSVPKMSNPNYILRSDIAELDSQASSTSPKLDGRETLISPKSKGNTTLAALPSSVILPKSDSPTATKSGEMEGKSEGNADAREDINAMLQEIERIREEREKLSRLLELDMMEEQLRQRIAEKMPKSVGSGSKSGH